MKIYSKIVYQWNQDGSFTFLECDSKDYHGRISNCGGGGGTTRVKQNADPWKGQAPYLSNLFGQAGNLYSNYDPSYYPNSTVAAQSPSTLQAQNSILNTAGQRDVNNEDLQKLSQDTLSGQYLYGGSGFNAALDAATRKITPQVNSAFGVGGRGGSGLAQTAQTQAIADAFAGQYGQERNNQMQMAQMAPMLNDMRYANAQRIGQVGQAQDQYAQKLTDADIQRFQYNQQLPYWKLQQYSDMIRGPVAGGSSSQTSPYYNNNLSSALGIGALGKATGAYGSDGWLASLFSGAGSSSYADALAAGTAAL